MALEEPEVSSENRGPGFVAIRREVIFTQDEPLLVCVCVSVRMPTTDAFSLLLQILLQNLKIELL